MSNTIRKKQKRVLPDILTPEEQQKLLAAPNPKVPTGLRNLCIIRIMLNAGLRCSEVLNLTPAHVNLNTGLIRITNTKTGVDRNLWLYDDDLDLVRQWSDIRPAKSKYLFCTLKGGQLSGRYVRQMVKLMAERAGLKKRIHPHLLRHTFASDMLRQTGNIRLVQKALGHASLNNTMIYTHIVDTELEDAMKNFRKIS